MRHAIVGRRRGFTLIEMLVSIAIIALLIGILIPALSNAMQAGRNARCMSNLRQFVIAMSGYAADNRDVYPRTAEGVIADDRRSVMWTTYPGSYTPEIADSFARQYGFSVDEHGRCPFVDRDTWELFQPDRSTHTNPDLRMYAVQYATFAGTTDDPYPPGYPFQLPPIENRPMWSWIGTTAPPATIRSYRARPDAVLTADTNMFDTSRSSPSAWINHSDRNYWTKDNDGLTAFDLAPVLRDWDGSNRARVDGSVEFNGADTCGPNDAQPTHSKRDGAKIVPNPEGSFFVKTNFYW